MKATIPVCVLVIAGGLLAPIGSLTAVQQRRDTSGGALPNFDARTGRPPALPAPSAAAELQSQDGRFRRARLHPHTGALKVLDEPGVPPQAGRSPESIRVVLSSLEARLGLESGDLAALELERDYVTASNGLRHVAFSQSFDGIPVFDGVISAHLDSSGRLVRVTSSAARGPGRSDNVLITSDAAARVAASNIRPDQPFSSERRGGAGGPQQRARFDRGPFLRDVTTELTWLPIEGSLRLAWRVGIEPDGEPQVYDVLVDAGDGQVLLRRNRVLYAAGTGRVIQSAATQAMDPRRPDENPAAGSACPPPANYELRNLTVPFRDPATVLSNTGYLSGNNVHVFHGNVNTEADRGTFDGNQWSFDFPFHSAGGAATTLFFAVNFAHDFFYDLGFTEAAGNFQQNNFGRGGLGNDGVKAIARAAGRNNATFQAEPEGTSPIISMFMWDGTGCWAQDVDGDGSMDLDGDYDIDVVLHEFHHGVSHRLNTAFTGSEADAIGEGGSDFFAYSINGDSTLAEYAYPGGLRSVNGKGYADWSCLLGFFCEPHANGEIFANVLWDVRERFRAELVRGSEAAAVNESHQLYVDALALSPPSPTMLDMRDAMLLADDLRNPGAPRSVNFCRVWESFAARGMGVNATDTEDNGSNQVHADISVPDGCDAPPPPPTVTLNVSATTATEAGPTSGAFTVSRGAPQSTAITVLLATGGSAQNGVDYVSIGSSVTIPAGAAAVGIPITAIDDTLLESNETATLSLRPSAAYLVGSPSSGTVTIVSDDLAPDFVVSALTVPQEAAAGQSVSVTDTTANQGTGGTSTSRTSFYLSLNFTVEASDHELGSRSVPQLAVGETSTATTFLTLPSTLAAGSYWLLAKADGPGAWTETSEANNIRSARIKIGPDLVVSSLTAPAVAEPGSSILVSDVTMNQGAGSAGGSQTRFYLSANYLLETSDTPLQSRAVGTLAAETSSSGSTSVTIPAGTATATYYLLAKADAADVVPESLETNNVKYVTIRVGPDLQVTSLSAPTTARSGGVIAVTDTTRNAGAGPASSSTTAFYLSSDYRLDASDARLTPSRAVSALAAGISSSAVTNVTLPAVGPGRWYLIAQADDLRVVLETLETNNTRYVTLAIGPDLDVTSMVAPTSAIAGTSISITDTVKNIGQDQAAASMTRFYLSLDPTLDSGDTVLGERAVGALAAAATSTGTANVVVPSTLSGSYYLFAMTDATAVVVESNEANNTYLRLITINPQ